MPEIFYRYVDGAYAPPVNEFDNICGESTPYIGLREYKVLKRTPKGVWIEDPGCGGVHDPKRFVLLTARKRFACPTREEALTSFLARKTRQHSIYMARAKHSEKVLATATARAKDLLKMKRYDTLTFTQMDWFNALQKAGPKAKVE